MPKITKKQEGKEIQLPRDKEARRCVLIVIEEHIGLILKIKVKNLYEYAVVSPYRKARTYTHMDGSVCCTKCHLTASEGCKHNQ